VGYPKLRGHPGAVIAPMKLSVDWHDFKTKLERIIRALKANAVVDGLRG
jgi:hypothetical protein